MQNSGAKRLSSTVNHFRHRSVSYPSNSNVPCAIYPVTRVPVCRLQSREESDNFPVSLHY